MMTSGGYLKSREESFRGEREMKTEAPHTRREEKKKRGRRLFFYKLRLKKGASANRASLFPFPSGSSAK